MQIRKAAVIGGGAMGGGIDMEIDNFARVTISKDAKEGTDAFQNKRKAVFRDM
jgi:3-hydroxyacyl-CoA dehydrogenase